MRLENEWNERFHSWGFHPSSHDRIIKDSACKVVNRRRADFVFSDNDLPYYIVVECDEESHSGYDIACEMKRLQEIHDQLIGNGRSVKPLVIIRFNPNSRHESLEKEVKGALEDALKGQVDYSDARGVNLFKVIGYGQTRQEKYREERLTYRLKI